MKKYLVGSIAIALVVTALGVGIYNIFNNNDFWDVSIAQILTLLVTILIAFWATQFKNDQRNAKAHAEKVIGKIQGLVACEKFYSFAPGSNERESKSNFRMSQRKIANCLHVLEDYANIFGFKDELKYIKRQFSEYKSFVSEKLDDFEYLQKSESHLHKFSQNIDSKCDLIIAKLYK